MDIVAFYQDATKNEGDTDVRKKMGRARATMPLEHHAPTQAVKMASGTHNSESCTRSLVLRLHRQVDLRANKAVQTCDKRQLRPTAPPRLCSSHPGQHRHLRHPLLALW